MLRFFIFRKRFLSPFGQPFDSFRQVGILDVVGPCGHAQAMGFKQYLPMGHPDGWLKFVAGQFDPLSKRVTEVDRMHKTAIISPVCLMPRSSSRVAVCVKVARETLFCMIFLLWG